MALSYFTRKAVERFVARRCAAGIEEARRGADALLTVGAPRMGLPPEVAQEQARRLVLEAEARQKLFDETVRPNVGASSAAGEVAERQLLLLAAMFQTHPDYREEWQA